MKKIICNFLIDKLFFSVIYSISFLFVIVFYQITSDNAQIIYPVMLALFFYVVYMLVALIKYIFFYRKLDRLQKNCVNIAPGSKLEKKTFNVINDIYNKNNNSLMKLKQRQETNEHFISAFIHNLKTPVTVSSIILQRAKKNELSEAEVYTGIENELSRITNGLNMLLDIQRLKELSNDYEPAIVDLEGELISIINENKSLFINNKVFPKFTRSEMPHRILTDSKWNRVLINQIISNAVKYSAGDDDKYVWFTIKHKGDKTQLVIQDQGIGIPSYDIPKVFDAFFTGENGRKGYNSSGIGLYLCKQICDRLGHTINISNAKEGKGLIVTITYLSKL